MSWYLGQSWLIILLSIALGLLIGWALWRRPWNKRYFSESEAITQVTREHSRTLAERDAEITRLRGLLDKSGARAATAVDVPSDDAEDAAGAAVGAAVTDEELATQTAEVRVPVETAESVDVDEVQTPTVVVDDAPTGGVDLAQVEAAEVDVSDDATAAAQVNGQAADARGSAIPAPLAGPGEDEGAGSTEASEDAEDAEDELERIEGVGPRIASALNAAGIATFRRVAASDVAELQSALEAAGLRFAPSLPTWSRQARLLAEGDETGFLELTEQLVAGRDVGRRG